MNMQRKTVFCLIAAVILMGLASVVFAGQAAIPVSVSVGKGTILTLKEPSKRVSIASPDIAELNLLTPTELLINGKKIGNTSLIIWNAQGKTTFFDIMVTPDLGQLREQLKEIAPNDDIRADMAGDTIILSGHAKNQQIVDKAVKLAQAYAVASDIKTTTSYVNGVAKETSESSGKVINQIIIDEAQQVMLEVKVAQVNKSKLKELGISFLAKGNTAEGFSNLILAPTSEGVSSSTGGTVTTFGGGKGIGGVGPGLGSFDPLDPFQLGVSYFPGGIGVVLKALAEKGYGRVLAEPNLLVRSGEMGKFHVGTRVPIQTVTGTGGNATVGITYEDVGIRLNFKPEVLETGAIRLKIDPAEVSNIARFLTFQGIVAPEIDTRTVNTSVDLREGESLILAGLLSDEMRKNIQKIPVLGDIPIFGALFRSSRDEIAETELAFFITPRLVKPMPAGQKPALPTDKTLTPAEEKEFNWIPLPGSSEGAK
ncbi:MAG: pilus assembly protein CpaC [Nitrospirae bacterium]|nr:pilus assembly protein CpaC [Nitrospirota bacterium]